MLEGASAHYGDSIGLSPIALASPRANQKLVNSDSNFWQKECSDHPNQIACLNYET